MGVAQRISDGMANVLTGLGINNPKVAAGHYVPDEGEGVRDAAYRASTWYRKIVNIPADDAVREWRAWQAEADQIEAVEAEEARLSMRIAVRDALVTSRHTGGAVIVPGGLPGQPEEPLRLDSIRRGSLTYLRVLGRNEITPGPLIRDPESPWFGQPEDWTIRASGETEYRLHPSRVALVNGRTVPGASRYQGDIWGDSIWTQMADSVRAADTAAGVIEALLHEAKIDVVRVPDFMAQMAAGGAEDAYIARWTMAARMKSLSNVLLLDGADEWSQKQISWAGLPEVARTLLVIMAGAADIPVTRLTGEQAKGMSGDDAGSLRNYYDHVRSMQELEYTPALAPLDEMLIRSALGSRPDDVWYRWRSLYQMDEKEAAEIDKMQAETAAIYANAGLVPDAALVGATQARMIETGRWPGLEAALADLPDMEAEESRARQEIE